MERFTLKRGNEKKFPRAKRRVNGGHSVLKRREGNGRGREGKGRGRVNGGTQIVRRAFD